MRKNGIHELYGHCGRPEACIETVGELGRCWVKRQGWSVDQDHRVIC